MGKTNKDIYRHVEELIFENERMQKENRKLKAENRDIRAENVRLRNHIEDMEATLEARIERVVEAAVSKAIAPLHAAIAEKDKEIMRLKSQLDKDSSNSSKLSGSNGFKKVPNNREKSKKKQGGQNGHKGSRLNIPENLGELVKSGIAEHVIVSEV